MTDQFYLGVKHFRIPRARIAPTAFSDDELRSVRVPTLLLIGRQEVLYEPGAALDRARKLIPRLQGNLVPFASHGMCSSQHQLVDDRVLDFLKTNHSSLAPAS
jgi:pimeloyl-ACP methyl ester carboxylesterase